MGLRTAIGNGLVKIGKAFTGSGAAPTGQAPVNVPAVMQQAATDQSYMGFEHTFAPGFPIGPYDGYQRHPRQQDFTTGYNIATRPRTYERVSFDTLNGLITNYDVAQICIYHRIDSIRSLDWRLVAREGYDGDVTDAIDAGMKALKKPDRERTFDNWLSAWLFDVLAYDAGCLYRLRNLAGEPVGLLPIDGKTVAPLLDYWGMRPQAPAEAYVQYVQGLPWNWLTQDDLIYQPMRPHTDSPYGHAPIEIVMLNANTDIRFQLYFLQRFTEGNLPAAFASAPETWTPDQIEQFQEYWDGFVYGDQTRKHQIRWIPGGSSFAWSDEKEFTDHFSLFLMRKTAAALHVVPADIGFTENVNRSSGESQADVQHRVGDLPLLNYAEGILDGFLQDDLGLPVKLKFDRGEEQVDQVAQAQADKIYVDMGAVGPSKIAEIRYGIADPVTIPRFIMTSRGGPVPVASLMAVAGEIDQATGLPAEGAKLPREAFSTVEGVLPVPPLKTMSLAERLYGPSAVPPAPPPQPKMQPSDIGLPGLAAQPAAGPVAKDGAGAGITAGTGIYSEPLLRDGNAYDANDDEDEQARGQAAGAARDQAGHQEASRAMGPVAKAAELAAFRRYSRARRRAGEWRDFRFEHHAPHEAWRLNTEGRASVAKAAGLGPPADPRVVYDQLLANYEPDGIAWVLATPWYGPADVPLDMVDTDDEDSWAASEPGANAEHVARLAAQIEAGQDVDPAVMVHVSGKARLIDVDGHHRYEACKRLGRPLRAYTGFPSGDDWQETHSFQQHSGGDPLNKAAGDDAALAFLLIRAPNRAGKLRYLLQKRADESPNPGTWGLPGGHAHPGEDPWTAAVREAGEELGSLPPLRRGPAMARTQGTQTVHTFLAEIPQMFTPDMAASATPGESAGWGWFSRKQVAGLDLHPAMAETWQQICDAGLDAPGSDWAAVSKAASGYDLNPRSGMISLDLPDGLIPPVPGGVDDHHITVVYLGPDVDDAAFTAACDRARQAAAAIPGPLEGTVSGIGCFPPSDSSDGKIPAWAAAAVPGAADLRSALEDLSASEHQHWAPHVTLAYLEQGDPLPWPLDPVPVTFACLSVHRGDEVARFPLGGEPVAKAVALGKLTHAEVGYRPAAGERRCGTCVMFRESNGTASCTLVQDPISPQGVCDRWQPAGHIPDGGSLGGTALYKTSADSSEAVEKAGKQGSPKPGSGPRHWPGWKLDLRTAAHWAPKVTAAAQQALPASRLRDIAAGYIADHPGQDGKATGKRARDAAALAWLASRGVTVPMDGPAQGIAADGVMIGAASAQAAASGTDDADTGGWQPGNTDAATRIAEGLGAATVIASVLADAGSGSGGAADLAGEMGDGYLAVVARVLAGWDPDVAAGELTDMLTEAVADGAYAEGLTVTQITAASGQAALDWYLENTVAMVRWVTEEDAKVCPRCLDNEAAGPVRAGHPFPSGDTRPPAHPRCRCAVIPDWA